MMVTGIAILAAVYWSKHVTIQEVKVNALTFVEQQHVNEAAAIPFGVKPDSLNLEEVIRRVESLDYIHSVTTYIEPSGDLRLSVKERQPIGLLINGHDRIYVDHEGVRLPILEGKIMDLPLVYGFSATQNDTLRNEAFLQIRDFLVQARNNDFGWTTISEVAFDKEEGVVALSHENGVKLLFGRNDFEMKLENWKAFYTEVIKTKGIDKMQQVDLRFTNQVVTREI